MDVNLQQHSPDSDLADAAARAEAANTLILSHPSICRDQQLICSLLQVSWGMRDAIQHALRGLLPVSLHRKQHLTAAAQAAAAERAALQLASWLWDHSSLVGSISLSLPRDVMDVVQDGITAALQHAAASPPGLLLRAVTTNCDSTALLQCLPSAHLTQLEFAHKDDDFTATAQVADILAGLTGLCSLRIEGGLAADHGPFLPVLATHTRLTSLEVDCVEHAEFDNTLPASLQKLHVRWNDVHPMHLGQATALTDLSLGCYLHGDLPPNVQLLKLQLYCGSSMEPFVALQHLRELHLGAAQSLPQADLVQLRDLTALSRLTLIYMDRLADDGSVHQAAQAWRQLTCLRELHIWNEPATEGTLQAIGSTMAPGRAWRPGLARSLECLELRCEGPGTHLVVDTLRMLTSLTRLRLGRFSNQHLAALRDMRQLRELELDGSIAAIDPAAALARAQHLAHATQLTKLVCLDGGVDDVVLSLSALTGLRHLDISGSRCTDAVLPVIARTMPHLTQLDVGWKFSAEGRAVLAAARPELLLTWY